MPTFVLIGHCGPDSYLLKHAVSRAVPGAAIVFADDPDALAQQMQGERVYLVNRLLDGSDLDITNGIELIARLKAERPDAVVMLVSNFADAQEQAMAAGAVQGFGKKAVNAAQTAEVLRAAAKSAAGSPETGD